eukprot:1140957-Pelagomonas_calceolata.AAC.3
MEMCPSLTLSYSRLTCCEDALTLPSIHPFLFPGMVALRSSYSPTQSVTTLPKLSVLHSLDAAWLPEQSSWPLEPRVWAGMQNRRLQQLQAAVAVTDNGRLASPVPWQASLPH